MAVLRRGVVGLLVLLGGTDCGARTDLADVTTQCLPGDGQPCAVATGGRGGNSGSATGGSATGGSATGGSRAGTGATDNVGGVAGAVTAGAAGTLVVGGSGGDAAGGVAGSGGVAGAVTAGSAGVSGDAGAGGSAGAGGNAPLTCDEGAENELYVISPQDVLYRIDPVSLALLSETTLDFPFLNSMALTADGTLFTSSWWGDLDAIDVGSGTIEPQPFDPNALGNNTSVCIGWADALPQAPDGALVMSMGEDELYAVDPTTLVATLLAPTSSGACELVGDPSGRLFGVTTSIAGASIIEIDTTTYQIVDELPMPGTTWTIYDIAYFQGSLYAFAGGSGSTVVYRVSGGTPLQDQAIEQLGVLPFDVVGAGARSCP